MGPTVAYLFRPAPCWLENNTLIKSVGSEEGLQVPRYASRGLQGSDACANADADRAAGAGADRRANRDAHDTSAHDGRAVARAATHADGAAETRPPMEVPTPSPTLSLTELPTSARPSILQSCRRYF